MYSEIKKELEEGKLLLEWVPRKVAPTVPLLKDKYGSDRRKAKELNFSIAHGKSARGFGVTRSKKQTMWLISGMLT